MRRKELIEKRNKKIMAAFFKLRDVQENGVRKYTFEYIYAQLGEIFYLSPGTIEKLIVKTKRKNK